MIGKGSYAELYIRVDSDVDQHVPITVSSAQQYIDQETSKYYQHGFSVGGVAFVAAIFLVLFLATRDKSLGILSAYFVCRALLLSALLGASLYSFFPEYQDLRGFELPILAAISSIFYLLFASAIFQIHQCAPQLNRKMRFIALGILATIPLSFMLSVDANIMLTSIVMTGTMILLAFVGIYLHKLQKRLALIFTCIMAIQCVFTIAIILGFYLEIGAFENRALLHISSFALNLVLIVFIISRLYYYQLQDKQKVQKEALANAIASKNAQEQLVQLQADNQEELEQRVQERTLELNIALNELEELNRELEQKNTIDELTSLYNRRFYDQKMLAEYRRSKRNLTPLSLVIIDIDHFKSVNDTYGHLAGDQCLSWLAQHIKQSLKRSSDIGCRYGGEEFCLLLPDTDSQGAIAVAEALRVAVEAFDFVYKTHHIPLTVSCGVSTYQQQNDALPEHLFLAADKALYQAKHSGRNTVKTLDITPELILQENSHD